MKLKRKIGSILVCAALVAATSVSAFAASNMETNFETTIAADLSYTEYVKGLDILDEKEMNQFIEAENEIDSLYRQIEPLFEKDTLTESEIQEMDRVLNQVDAVYSKIGYIYDKIYNYEETLYGSSCEDAAYDDTAEDFDYIEYVKDLNVLNQEEFAKFVEIENQVDALYLSIEPLFVKDTLTAEEELQIEKVFDQIDDLQSSINNLYDKIGSAETDIE